MMFSVIAILVIAMQLAAVTADCPESSLSSRTLVSPEPGHEPTPWHAVIYRKKPDTWVPLCGGTLVSPSHVVTAANCFWSPVNQTFINLPLFEVAVGKHCQDYENLEEDAQLFKVKSVTLHPWFSWSTSNLQLDVAVVELKTPAILTSGVSPALIERQHACGDEHLPPRSSGTVADWLGSESRSLSSVQLPYMNFSACADLVHPRHGLVPSLDKFCAGAKDDMRTLCRQDIGTGFIYKHPTSNETILRGVFSTDLMPTQFTETCHQSDVAGFTNIADPLTLNWLTRIIPAPPVPCPAVLTSTAVFFVYCHKEDIDVDCSLPMTSGTTAVSRCSIGYHIAGSKKSKTSTCGSDGTWSDANVTCVKVDPCDPSPCGPSSQCVESNGGADCACLPTYLGRPPNCRPECDVSADCGLTSYCANNTCHDVNCVGACAAKASCKVVDHSPRCSCFPGYTGDARASCSLNPAPGYQRLAGLANLYKHHGPALNWHDAKTSCEAEGAHLVILNSEQEYTGMLHLIRQNHHTAFGYTGCLPECTWVGLKESDSRQHEFFTVLGQPLSSTGFSRWHPERPIVTSLGDGVYIKPNSGGLDDWGAGNKIAYICELEV